MEKRTPERSGLGGQVLGGQVLLTQRLRQLEAAGLVERRMHEDAAEVPTPVSYRLTEEGQSLGPVLQALYDWGAQRAAERGIRLPQPAE